MNKKIIAISLCFVIACGIFAGCRKKAAEAISVIVTDENGVAVTDENGEIVTEMATPVTDKDGNAVTEKATNSKGEILTDANGDPKTVVVTEAAGGQTTSSNEKVLVAPDKVPYSTTAPENNKAPEEWTFGDLTTVACNAPNGWKNEAVNQLVQDDTDIRVVVNPINFLSGYGYKTIDDYIKFTLEGPAGSEKVKNPNKQLSFKKEVYKDGAAAAILIKSKNTESTSFDYGNYHMIYFFQTGNRIRSYYVYSPTEEGAKIDISEIIANTYYRG